MRVTVTGATGFIGRALCKQLLAHGHEVTALTRDTGKAQEILGADVKCVVWGGTKKDDWLREAATADVLIHLAGESVGGERWTEESKKKLMSSRVNGLRDLFEAMRVEASAPPVFIYASGIGYYGDGGEKTITESSPKGQGFLADLSATMENEVAKASHLPMRSIALRIGIVLGANGGALEKMLYPGTVRLSPWKLGLGGNFGDGSQWFPWVHLDDVTGMILWSMQTPKAQGALNVVAPQHLRNRDFTKLLGDALKRPALIPAPGFLLKALVGGFAEALLTGQKAEPALALKLGYAFKYQTLSQALAAILKEQK